MRTWTGHWRALAPYVGVYGMSFVAAFVAVLLLQLLKSVLRKPNNPVIFQSAAIAALLLVLPKLAVNWLPTDTGKTAPLQVTLLQGNIPQNEKFQAGSGVATALGWYAEQLEKVQSGLVVTPETAIPLLPQNLPPEYWRNLQQPFKAENGQKARSIGIPMGSRAAGFQQQRDWLQAHAVSVVCPLPVQQRPPRALWRVHPALRAVVY